MTTDNLSGDNVPEIEELLAELGRLGNAVERRIDATERELEGVDKREANARLGYRAVRRNLADMRAALQEERDQLDWIRSEEEQPEPEPEEPSEPEETPAEPEPEPEPEEPPTREEPTAEVPVTEPEPEEVRPEPSYVTDVREWSRWQWAFAFAGLFIALVLFSSWPEWPGRNMDEGWVQSLTNFGWFVAHAGTGFFLGGWIGFRFQQRRDDDGDESS